MRLGSRLIAGIVVALSLGNTAVAQGDSATGLIHNVPGPWLLSLAITGSAALDPEAREWTSHEHSPFLNRLAKTVNHIGTARYLVPGMAASYGVSLLFQNERLARATVITAAAYVTSDVAESALKPLVGRERPHVAGNSRRFHPFTANGDWHSLPSAHVAHITSVIDAISEQNGSTSALAVGSSLIALTAWDRIYEDQHWLSDVVVTIALSSAISHATVRWLQSHWTSSH